MLLPILASADPVEIDINPNPTEVIVYALERDYTYAEQEDGTGQPWDNQFFIVANRTLSAGEMTVVEFDYVATKDAMTTTECHAQPEDYLCWNCCIGEVDFTTAEQHFKTTFTVPIEADGMQTIAFHMAVIKEACDYKIKNIVWKLEDNTESLIDMEGSKNFFVKEGADDDVHEYVPNNNDYDVWSLVGDQELFGSDWDITDTKNRMRSNDGVNYTRTKTDVTLEKGTYHYKVAKDNAWDVSYPAENAELVIDEYATYKITFTFNAETHQLSAVAEKTDGIYYKFITKGKIAEVIDNPNKYKGKVIIPATVMHEGIEYNVKSIGSYAFSGCRGLTSVTIPNSVTSIGNYAFADCSGLTSVTIPNSVTSIDGSIFSGCTGLTSVTIPNSVTSIDGSAFSGCTSLTSVTIPNSVTSIDGSAFSGCTGLTSVTIPNSVTYIGNNAFSGCTSLTSVTIPNSVTSIGNNAFANCSGLTSITIPNSVTSIGEWAFFYCSGLTSITIPNSVTSIGWNAFNGCSGLISVTIGNSVTSIGSTAFYGCTGLTSITIPNSVTSIDGSAFSSCEQLTDVYCLPDKVNNNSYDGEGLYTDPSAFADSYPEYITLHVPATSAEAYGALEPWKNFKEIVGLNGEEIPATPKCATPTISLVDGKITFSCETEDVEYISEVTVNDAKKYYDNDISVPKKFKVKVYATKANYDNSDTATAEFDFSGDTSRSGDVDGNGIVNVADHVKLSSIIMDQNE